MPPTHHGNSSVIDAFACKDNQVYVHVGPKAEEYLFFKSMFRGHSPVLADRLKQGEDIIDLKEWPRSSYRIYVYWACSRCLPGDHSEWWWVINQDDKNEELCLLERLQACAFGREMGMHAFANACYNSFVTAARATKLPPSYEVIRYAFTHLPKNENLLTFLVDMYVIYTRTSVQIVSLKDLPNEFFVRMVLKTEELGQGAFTGVMHACAYHIHASDEERDQCPAHILNTTNTPFRLLGDAIVKVLAEMRKKATHGLAEAVLRVLQLVTGSASNGQLLIDYVPDEYHRKIARSTSRSRPRLRREQQEPVAITGIICEHGVNAVMTSLHATWRSIARIASGKRHGFLWHYTSSAAAAGIVVVEVGTEAKKYHVHKALLTSQSDFFKKAFTGSWKEARGGVVRLGDVEPRTNIRTTKTETETKTKTFQRTIAVNFM
ncbi:hypothetical protein P171DRAFT_475343 [Karstenula rhodostoma CBS 690.94]|uniref:BTB domain-containing protein n=1 Tax=Karstenula rhodostoma CBS 690.94 TaxID=1392251 RepID=A0A9P4PBH3_9PLEO|nr:hypothetical protein P171DRAFT_475343 [Karstenula rhodostoma CBS 690.94]